MEEAAFEPEEIKFDVETEGKECTFVKFKAHNEKFCDINTPLIAYKLNGSTKTFKNTKKGILRFNDELKEGNPLAKDDVVAWMIGPCKHEVVFGDTCAVCCISMVG